MKNHPIVPRWTAIALSSLTVTCSLLIPPSSAAPAAPVVEHGVYQYPRKQTTRTRKRLLKDKAEVEHLADDGSVKMKKSRGSQKKEKASTSSSKSGKAETKSPSSGGRGHHDHRNKEKRKEDHVKTGEDAMVESPANDGEADEVSSKDDDESVGIETLPTVSAPETAMAFSSKPTMEPTPEPTLEPTMEEEDDDVDDVAYAGIPLVYDITDVVFATPSPSQQDQVTTPTTEGPTTYIPTFSPTSHPTLGPNNGEATTINLSPTTIHPSRFPTIRPTTTNPTTNSPTRDLTSEPTLKPTLEPSSSHPTVSPSPEPTGGPTPLSYCPPAYDFDKMDYVPGELVEVESFIFECSNVQYCNVPYPDMLAVEEMEEWATAWTPVHACYTTETPSGGPTTRMPTREPSLNPSTVHPTVSPSFRPTDGPTHALYCPPAYNFDKTDYFAGQRVEMESFIFECSNVQYCNVPNPDMLTEEELAEWTAAWTPLHACYTTETPSGGPTTRMPTLEPSLNPSSSHPTISPSSNPTNNPTPQSYCPPAYDFDKTDYVAGQLVEVESFIFECSNVQYCNVHNPDMLSEEELARWNTAWTPLHACYRTETPSLGPTTRVPTLEPSLNPTSTHPTISPSSQPTISPTPQSYCPPAYVFNKTDYVVGQQVEVESFIFECNNVQYCNVHNPDAFTVREERSEQTSAWTPLHACYTTETPSSGPTTRVPTLEPSLNPTSSHPTKSPSFNPTNGPTSLSYCPPAYDYNKTNYIIGQLVEAESFVFACSNVQYCNVPYPFMLTEDEAEEWNTAWTPLHECYRTDTPSASPTTEEPSVSPSKRPSTMMPTKSPTDEPSRSPISSPSKMPTSNPSSSPTSRPSYGPTKHPTLGPSLSPLSQPTASPIVSPTLSPSRSPNAPVSVSAGRTKIPISEPSHAPSIVADHSKESQSRNNLEPTTSPTKLDTTICPDSYNPSVASTYNAGTDVEVSNVIYRCNPIPYAYYCTLPHFRPDPYNDSNAVWKDAWEAVAPCRHASSNTLTEQPTQKPVTESPSNQPTSKPVTDDPTKQPTQMPVTDSPSTQVLLSPPHGLPVNPATITIPQKRFIEWTMLDQTDKITYARNNLGYKKNTWNTPGSHEIETWSFGDLYDNEVAGAQGLGITNEMWDCHINHYAGYYWADLKELGVDQYFIVLGWDIDSWENDAPVPEADDVDWEDLTALQRAAAMQVCYHKDLWNEVPIPQWQMTVSAVATDGPISSPVRQSTLPPSSPTEVATLHPSNSPTGKPVTDSPTHQLSSKPVTDSPTEQPTKNPVTDSPSNQPTAKPVTDTPTEQPTQKPATESPSNQPTAKPVTDNPTKQPTQMPVTDSPSKQPTAEPSSQPTKAPMTSTPTRNLSVAPSKTPTPEPSTISPTKTITSPPSSQPSIAPTTPEPSTKHRTLTPSNQQRVSRVDDITTAPSSTATATESSLSTELYGLPINPVTTNIPFKRFLEWSLLSDSDMVYAEINLGYDRKGWNKPGTNDVESWSYHDLYENEMVGAQGLGIDNEMWDCHINHYDGYWWEDIEHFGYAQYFNELGWSAEAWDNGEPPETDDLYWDELTSRQQAAAAQLCWHRDLWNEVSIPMWGE